MDDRDKVASCDAPHLFNYREGTGGGRGEKNNQVLILQ